MPKLSLRPLPGLLSIHRFPVDSEIPEKVSDSTFLSICRTDDELSIVCDSAIRLDSEESNDRWACLKVLGPLDFSLTGVLAGISTCLATSGISIFVVSTFDTDYILVKSDSLDNALSALAESGYDVADE